MKPPKFVTNLSDLDFGGLVADWNFPNPLVADWIEKLAFTCPIRLAHTPSKGPKLDKKPNKDLSYYFNQVINTFNFYGN